MWAWLTTLYVSPPAGGTITLLFLKCPSMVKCYFLSSFEIPSSSQMGGSSMAEAGNSQRYIRTVFMRSGWTFLPLAWLCPGLKYEHSLPGKFSRKV